MSGLRSSIVVWHFKREKNHEWKLYSNDKKILSSMYIYISKQQISNIFAMSDVINYYLRNFMQTLGNKSNSYFLDSTIFMGHLFSAITGCSEAKCLFLNGLKWQKNQIYLTNWKDNIMKTPHHFIFRSADSGFCWILQLSLLWNLLRWWFLLHFGIFITKMCFKLFS